MNYVIRPMNDRAIGAEILDLDLTGPLPAELRAQLNRELATHCVLAFRSQRLSPDQFLRAGQIFGDIESHSRKSGRTAENADVFEIRNKKIAEGKQVVQGDSFHTDQSNTPVPPKATSLHAVQLPTTGGDTQFVNMHRAYDELPAALRTRITGLKAVHAYQSKYSPRELPKLDAESLRALPPPAIHPLVRIHPDNGRKFLYLNPVRIESVIGIPDDEAQALIKELMAHSTQAKYEYRHQWCYGDMVIWDNRSVMHQATADYNPDEVRRLYRIMIKGALHASEMPPVA